MSDVNGKPNDRLDRLEASHVQLMTEHEEFVREQDREWARQQDLWKQAELDREVAKARSAAIDAQFAVLGERIDKLVSGIGELVRRGTS